MRRSPVVALAFLGPLFAGVAFGEGTPPVELRRLFPQEADVFAEKTGLARLVLPPEILAACRPDLSDLRLFDSRGRETAYLVDAGTAPPNPMEVVQRFSPRVLEAARAEIRREHAPPLRRETFEMGLPQQAPQTGHWVLVLVTGSPEFVARARVTGIRRGGETVPLLENGSVFRLRGPVASEKLRLSLPPFEGQRLRIVLETEHPFWLAPQFRIESARLLERSGRVAVPLEVLSTRGQDGRTIVDLTRPHGIVPDLLRLETTTGTFDRKVEVWDEGPTGGRAPLGTGRVFRVTALLPVGEQEMALGSARGDRLRVEIEDGDSPPLEGLSFLAVIRQPSLIFSLSDGGPGQAAATLRFGGGRAHPPHYDLAGLLPPQDVPLDGKRAEAAAVLYDKAALQPARLGPMRRNADYDGAPALAFAMHPGALIDRRMFSHLRHLTVPATPEGLSSLRIEPADLAVLNDDLSDLRVADDTSRQWPYLLEPAGVTELVPLLVAPPTHRDGRSHYPLRPPVSTLRFDRLLLDTEAGFFDRPFRLEAKNGGGESRVISQGRLARPVGDPRPLSLEVDPVRASSFDLTIENGDDAPLVLHSVQARVLLPRVYLTAPEGQYALLLGDPDQEAPRYELERVRDVVLAVAASPIQASPLESNRDYSLKARLKGQGARQTALLWAALLAAVFVLVVLTLRLARRETKPSS